MVTMKAIVITTPGDPSVLQLVERPQPEIGNDDVLIRVMAAGVNRPDVIQRKGNYPAPAGAPQDIPGLEVAGIITAIGNNVSQWKAGDKVCALVAGGGYAEYVNVNAGQCLPVPDHFSFAQAAGLPETVFTVWSNVFQRGRLQPGETLLVHGGSSGIGTTAIQLAKNKKVKVIVTVGSEQKGKKCAELGADRIINYKTQDFEKELADERVDVILDMVGGEYFDKNLNILAPDGRLVYINATNGNMVQLNITKMMQKRITITGSTLRARNTEFKTSLTADIYKNVWPMLETGKFEPVVFATFPLVDAHKAHNLMESGNHVGKIILINE